MNKKLLKNYPIEGRDPYTDPAEFKLLNIQMIKRYEFAKKFCKGLTLDAACGPGYGSQILKEKADHIIGIDNSGEQIKQAQNKYQNERIEYKIVDMEGKIPFDDSSFDTIVSLETIEHIKNSKELINSFYRILKDKGHLILSNPNALNTSPSGKSHYNPFHEKEFSKEELTELLNRNKFQIKGIYSQCIIIGSLLNRLYQAGVNPKDISNKKYLTTIANNLPFFNTIFSWISPYFINTSKQLIFVAQKNQG